MDPTEIALRLIGAFYVFAGFVASRAALMGHVLDKAIAALGCKPVPRAEVHRTGWLLLAAAIVLLGGLALVLKMEAALALFFLSAAGQALYLGLLSPRYFDRNDPPDSVGRRQTTNAFVIYLAATAFVAWAHARGHLVPFAETPAWALVALALTFAAHLIFLVRSLASASADSNLGDGGEDPREDDWDPTFAKRVKVKADYGCFPLWALDDGRNLDFNPERLDLSPELMRDLMAWGEVYWESFHVEDIAKRVWSDEEYRQHEQEGRRLAASLKAERPDLMVYVEEADARLREVQPDARSGSVPG